MEISVENLYVDFGAWIKMKWSGFCKCVKMTVLRMIKQE